ncbi:hypothetical protein [Herbaspirillum sp. RV1423]|uniref:hypothetical protein n=1 Tax=Herbaspirillum sp. RV1423 TaxID=1443993 RepID=UPI0012DF2E5B|nr:hypothetical protein [Herbaspirillum sp. RV1423]
MASFAALGCYISVQIFLPILRNPYVMTSFIEPNMFDRIDPVYPGSVLSSASGISGTSGTAAHLAFKKNSRVYSA